MVTRVTPVEHALHGFGNHMGSTSPPVYEINNQCNYKITTAIQANDVIVEDGKHITARDAI